MNDDPTSASVRDVLTGLRAQFAPGELRDGWEAWRGASGILYARRRLTSPPVVLRAATIGALAGEIRQWQASRR